MMELYSKSCSVVDHLMVISQRFIPTQPVVHEIFCWQNRQTQTCGQNHCRSAFAFGGGRDNQPQNSSSSSSHTVRSHAEHTRTFYLLNGTTTLQLGSTIGTSSSTLRWRVTHPMGESAAVKNKADSAAACMHPWTSAICGRVQRAMQARVGTFCSFASLL